MKSKIIVYNNVELYHLLQPEYKVIHINEDVESYIHDASLLIINENDNYEQYTHFIPVIIILKDYDSKIVHDAYRKGIVDYLCMPFDKTILLTKINRNLLFEKEKKSFKSNGNSSFHLNGKKIVKILEYLEMIFDSVRLIDAELSLQYILDENHQICKLPNKCYEFWNHKDRCGNCICQKALSTKQKLSKFEFLDDKICHVVAVGININDKTYVLELLTKIDDKTILDGHGKDKLIQRISEHNKKLYIDALTQAYNRRYYEEQLCHLKDIEAVVMLDADDFKYVNDNYGHAVGDKVLRKIASIVMSHIRSTDSFVRYGGDEFVIVFRGIPYEVFERKLQQIKEHVHQAYFEEAPDYEFSISIGGAYGKGCVEDMVNFADKLMYEAKQTKNSVKIDKMYE